MDALKASIFLLPIRFDFSALLEENRYVYTICKSNSCRRLSLLGLGYYLYTMIFLVKSVAF